MQMIKITHRKTKVNKKVPWCPLLPQHYDRYKHIRASSSKFFIAANLFNSERVIPNLAMQIMHLVEFLGKDRVFISIYENGSNDGTPVQLDIFRDSLDSLGIPNKIVSESGPAVSHLISLNKKVNWTSVHRIEKLAELRNEAMRPLHDLRDTVQFDSVIFINDVFFCMSDILELLYTRANEESHITCGLDFVWSNRVCQSRSNHS